MIKRSINISRENLYAANYNETTTINFDDGGCNRITLDFLYRFFAEVVLCA